MKRGVVMTASFLFGIYAKNQLYPAKHFQSKYPDLQNYRLR